MSVQNSQKRSSPGAKGPMKAILPMSSLMRQTNLKKCKSNSPILSPTFKNRFSPDSSLSGLRSPGSKGKWQKENKSHGIRRTASLDAIYLQEPCPRDVFYMNYGMLQVDKTTQTDEWIPDRKPRHSDSICDDVKLEKYIRHKLQRVNKDQTNHHKLGLRLISPPITGDHNIGGGTISPCSKTPPNSIKSGPQSPLQSVPLNINVKNYSRPTMRNSVEGLNQEIERLVLKDFDDRYVNYNSIPEGHRAPLAELFRQTRSVNTQTPGSSDDVDIDFCSSNSVSPMICGNLDLLTTSRGSSPEELFKFGTSPHINKFLAREPPDGCERVNLKLEECRSIGFTPLQPTTAIQFKPSSMSAFHPLISQDKHLFNGQYKDDQNQGNNENQQD